MREGIIYILLGLSFVGDLAMAVEPVMGVTLDARPAASQVLVGEPVLLHVVLENQATNAMRVLYPARTPFHIGISRDGTTFEGFWPFERMVTGPRGGHVLKSGEQLRSSFLLVRNVRNVLSPPTAFQFPLFGAGTHQIRVTAQILVSGSDSKSVNSEPIKIEVIEPTGSDQDMWLAVRNQPWLAPLLQHSQLAGTETDHEATVERLLNQFPTSVYAQHIALALGRHYLTKSYTRGGGQGSEAEFREYQARAMRYFRQAAEMKPVPWVREEALLEVAKLVGGAEAVAICDRARNEFPNSPLRPQFEQLRAAWQQELEREAAQPKDAIARVEEELIGMGYDLSNLTDDQKHAINYDIIRATWDECEERKLGNAECDDLLIRRYKEWAQKNLTSKTQP